MDITLLAYLEPGDTTPDVVVEQAAAALTECGHETSVLTIRRDVEEFVRGALTAR